MLTHGSDCQRAWSGPLVALVASPGFRAKVRRRHAAEAHQAAYTAPLRFPSLFADWTRWSPRHGTERHGPGLKGDAGRSDRGDEGSVTGTGWAVARIRLLPSPSKDD